MPDYDEIYIRQAEQYELLTSYEDCQGKLLQALSQLRSFEGLDIVEFGAGTGRLTRMIAPLARTVLAFDAALPMLRVALELLRDRETRPVESNWLAAAADHRCLPLPGGVADLAIAGWTFGHFTGWYPESWRDEIGRILAELRRVLRPGGTAIIIETLGTGQERPSPPSDALAAYYAWLEEEHRFSSTWIRTDFRFPSRAEAARLLNFFFDSEFDDLLVVRGTGVDLPECTGIWWRRL
jgi:ubiquinone/menaquinone biosynthesis C-methylase UbiE